MNQEYITANAWSIIEDDFDKGRVKSSESLFSLGNGAMGQRANFEETYTGDTFQGSYIAGVYYPDKTRVGWWKNGYPEYFAKVLNAPNWIGINVTVNGVALDLNTCKSITNYKRELNMKEGWYERSFTAILPNDVEVNVSAKRFLSLTHDELGVINYKVTPVNTKAVIEFSPYIDAGITNEDTNWDDKFWDILSVTEADQQGFISSKTMKTEFHVGTYMQSLVFVDGQKQNLKPSVTQSDSELYYKYTLNVNKGEEASIQKFAGYVTDMNHKTSQLIDAAKTVLKESINLGYETLLKQQKDACAWSRERQGSNDCCGFIKKSCIWTRAKGRMAFNGNRTYGERPQKFCIGFQGVPNFLYPIVRLGKIIGSYFYVGIIFWGARIHKIANGLYSFIKTLKIVILNNTDH